MEVSLASMTSGQPADYAAIKAQSLKDTEAGRVPSDEESFKFPEFKLGMELHELVHLYWKYADDLRERIKEVPFGMNSQDEGGGWWFSWATQANDASSCLYRIFPDGAVFCREFPNDKISLNTFDAKLNVAVVVISDLAQLTPQAWDAQSSPGRIHCASRPWNLEAHYLPCQ